MDGRAVVRPSWFTLDRHDTSLDETTPVNLSDDQALDLLNRLVVKLASQQQNLDIYDRYYRGTQPLSFLHPDVARAVGDRLRSMVINLPRLALDSLEERIDLEGFRHPDEDRPNAELRRIWQANDFDLASGRVHAGALRHGRAFVTVWSGRGDKQMPQLAPETARQMAVEYYPGTTEVRAAAKQWQDGRERYATLYLPDRVLRFVRSNTTARSKAAGSWALRTGGEIANPLGVVPVIPFLNRFDLDMPDGESELADVIHLADAINKLATDMMVSSEFHAMPRRWATGLEIPKAGPEHRRLQAEAKEYWKNATAGDVWLGGKDVNFGQFGAAELANFVNAIGMLTGKVAALFGLPPHYVGINGDNPASADAIRSSEASLVKRAQRKQRTWSEPWEDVMALAVHVRDGKSARDADELETVWRDPQTPTVAQKADAATKLVGAGLIDIEQGQEDLGYTDVQRQRMWNRKLAAVAAQADPDMRDRLAEALRLMETGGIDAHVAFATVGLITAPKGQSAGPDAPPPVDDDAAAA